MDGSAFYYDLIGWDHEDPTVHNSCIRDSTWWLRYLHPVWHRSMQAARRSRAALLPHRAQSTPDVLPTPLNPGHATTQEPPATAP